MQRLAGTIMWDRASPAARAVAEPVVEAWPPEIAKDKALTEAVFAVSPSEVGSQGSRACGTTCAAEMAAVAESVAETRPLEMTPPRQSPSLFVKLGISESLNTVLSQSLNSQCFLVKPGPRGPERKTRPVPPLKQLHSLLMGLQRRCGRNNSRKVCWGW